jgi:hypothetical protein
LGNIFVDRDSSCFAYILQYLRTQGLPAVPPQLWVSFFEEALFYGLEFPASYVLRIPFIVPCADLKKRDPRGQVQDFAQSYGFGGSVEWSGRRSLSGYFSVPAFSAPLKSLHNIINFISKIFHGQIEVSNISLAEESKLTFNLPATTKSAKNTRSPFRDGDSRSESDIDSVSGDDATVFDELSCKQVTDWLSVTELHELVPKFKEHNISGSGLSTLVDSKSDQNGFVRGVFDNSQQLYTFSRLLKLFAREVRDGWIVDDFEKDVTVTTRVLSFCTVGEQDRKEDDDGESAFDEG